MAVLKMQTRFANIIAKFGKFEKRKDACVRKSRIQRIYAVFSDINIQPIKILENTHVTIFQRSHWLGCPGFSQKMEQKTAVLVVKINVRAKIVIRGLRRTVTI